MPSLRPARTLTVSIAAPAAAVYAFMVDPRQLPRWARGLGATLTPLVDGAWPGPEEVVVDKETAADQDFEVGETIVLP